ncbi:putative disease resistance RPP13-like protein 1 [Rutidosis leptorrhynchoides]|uniref:putative disease resistance RPP13-like protein 1 n=1 Tax=Rutidosis leptorrhynchoides TaxID=125765 RepID=UPI003A990478
MAIGELFLGVFLNVLFEKMAYPELIRLARSVRVDSELDKWRSTFTLIQAVLVDAGKKHLENISIQLWLNELHHLAYDIDDVLDDLATEAMRHPLIQQSRASTSKVLKFIPNKFHALKYEELVDVSGIVGREGDKEALIGKLVWNESCDQNVSIMSIVGLDGIGKTTLARLFYNDKKVKDHFELTSWVCVSDEFNVFNISKAIFKDVGGDDRKFEALNQLQVAISEKKIQIKGS